MAVRVDDVNTVGTGVGTTVAGLFVQTNDPFKLHPVVLAHLLFNSSSVQISVPRFQCVSASS